MTNIDELGAEITAAKNKLKEINTTINRDRWVVEDLEKEIKEKENKILSLNNEIEAKMGELEWVEALVDNLSKDYGEKRDELKWEVKKLGEKMKKDLEKYDSKIEELSNDVKILEEKRNSLKEELRDLEDQKRKELKDKDEEIYGKENDIKKLNDKLTDIKVKYDGQKSLYDKKTKEIKEMNDELKQLDEIEENIERAEKTAEAKEKILKDINENIRLSNEHKNTLTQEIRELEAKKAQLERDCEGFVKMKMDIRDRNERLEAREKAIKKKYEEAGIKWE